MRHIGGSPRGFLQFIIQGRVVVSIERMCMVGTSNELNLDSFVFQRVRGSCRNCSDGWYCNNRSNDVSQRDRPYANHAMKIVPKSFSPLYDWESFGDLGNFGFLSALLIL
jgi:hypothetical protein